MERISYQEAPKGLYDAMINTEQYLRASGIGPKLMELIKIRASQINKCGYCLDMHHKDALKAGESFDRLYLLPAWREAPCYTPEEKAVLLLTETLTKISENEERVGEAYAEVAQYYSKEEIANLTLAICQINSWNRIAITFGNVPGSYKG